MARIAARLSARSAGALAFGRNAAACLHAGEVHRPHPRHRGAEPDRSGRQRGACARRSLAAGSASCPIACRASASPKKPPQVFDKNPQRRGPDPRQARHLHLRRRRARVLRAHDRIRHARRGAAGRKTASRCSRAQACRTAWRRRARWRRSCAALCTLKDAGGEGAHRRPILDFRTSDAILAFVNGKDLARYAGAGVITPDHVIRVKPWPLIVPAPAAAKLDAFKTAAQKAAQKFSANYQAYFARNKSARAAAVMHDPLPRVVLVPGLGLFGLGASAKDARDRRRHRRSRGRRHHRRRSDRTLHARSPKPTCSIANIGRWNWPSSGARKDLPLAGQVAVDHRRRRRHRRRHGPRLRRSRRRSGAARSSTPKAAQRESGKTIGGAAHGAACDVTDAASVRAAFARWSPRSAASISWCRMPAPPGRAASAKSTKRPCARASN